MKPSTKKSFVCLIFFLASAVSQYASAQVDSDSFASAAGQRIKSNIAFAVPAEWAKNDPVEYTIHIASDGSVEGVFKVRSSGLDGFDEAVKRAILLSQPFSPDKNGKIPDTIGISCHPREISGTQPPLSSEGAFRRGLDLFRSRDFAGAERAFKDALDAGPSYPLSAKIHQWLEYSYYAQKKHNDSISEGEVLLRDFSQFAGIPDTMLNIAANHYELQQVDKAVETLNSLIAKYPSSPQANSAKERLEQISRNKKIAEIQNEIKDDPSGNLHKSDVSPRTATVEQAMFYKAVQNKIEKVGTLNFPEKGGKKLYGELTVYIPIYQDGKIYEMEGGPRVERSSGNPDLDKAALRIIRRAAPFQALPKSERTPDKDDVWEIITRFKFTRDESSGASELESTLTK